MHGPGPVTQFAKQTYQDELVRVAKRLQRLQTTRAKYRRGLKGCDQDIKTAKRELKALCAQLSRGE